MDCQENVHMTLEELKALIVSGEGETQEVKETTGQRGDACETLCGFFNFDIIRAKGLYH